MVKRVNSVLGILPFNVIKLLLGENGQINWGNLEKVREIKRKTKTKKSPKCLTGLLT